jgi:hypothetical protein
MAFGDALAMLDAAGSKGFSFNPSNSLTVSNVTSTFGESGAAKDFTIYGKVSQGEGQFDFNGTDNSSIDVVATKKLTIGANASAEGSAGTAAKSSLVFGKVGEQAGFKGDVLIEGSLFVQNSTSQDLVVLGNLTVQGTQTILNTQVVEVEDTIIYLGKNSADAGNVVLNTSADMGIKASWYDSVAEAAKVAGMYFDVSAKEWAIAANVSEAGTPSNLTPAGSEYGQLHLKTLSVQDAGAVSGLGELTIESAASKDLKLTAAANLVVSVAAGKSLLMNEDKFTVSANGAAYLAGNLSIAESLVSGKVFSVLGDASIKGALDIRNSAGQVKTQILQTGVAILEDSLAIGNITLGANKLAVKGDTIFGVAGDSAAVSINGGNVVLGGAAQEVYATGKVRTETALKLEKKAAMVVPVAIATGSIAAGDLLSASNVSAAGVYTTVKCNAESPRVPVFFAIGTDEAALPGTFVACSPAGSPSAGDELFLQVNGTIGKAIPEADATNERHVIRVGFAMADGMIFAPAYITQIPVLAA